MGCIDSITCDMFPKQDENFLNKRVKVYFHYDTSKFIKGYIVRYDMMWPFRTIIKLDDERYIVGTECQYSLISSEDRVAEVDDQVKEVKE